MTPAQLDDLYDTLAAVAEYLDDQADVVDGDDYGQPQPNQAMRLHQRVEQHLLDMDARKQALTQDREPRWMTAGGQKAE